MDHGRKVLKSGTKAMRILGVIVALIVTVAIMEASVFAASGTEAGAGPEVIIPKVGPNLAVRLSADGEYPHTSLLFTVADVVFFSYEDGTMLELYNSSNTLIWNNGG